eukprot:GEMP01008632.1.p1 GENE.GEMP01008632.1~~GEMP01008632.1.p1  ORF type:complete len:584 (+),score=98.76 GEMP01008632.1:49-1800(+)
MSSSTDQKSSELPPTQDAHTPGIDASKTGITLEPAMTCPHEEGGALPALDERTNFSKSATDTRPRVSSVDTGNSDVVRPRVTSVHTATALTPTVYSTITDYNPNPQGPPGDPAGCNPVLLNVAPKNPEKIVVVLVGLPARGKTHIARRLVRYLDFFHNCPTRTFNVGDYRRQICGHHLAPDFFDHSIKENVESRNKACVAALADLKAYMYEANDCRVSFFDATNSTKQRRRWLHSSLIDMAVKPIFLESICTDNALIMNNIRKVKVGSPDFQDVDEEVAFAEFQKRIDNYQKVYETIDPDDELEKDWTWIKILNCKRFTINNLGGYLPTQMVQFLMHTHMDTPSFFLSRHGQSQYNQCGKIGGDSDLSESGWEYAKKLADYAAEVIAVDEQGNRRPTRLWTSTLRRTKDTALYIEQRRLTREEHGCDWVQFRAREWRNLDEIYAGSCDGMTYAEIEEAYPEEFAQRKHNKLTYRYPRGESYFDLIHRLHNCILEMERSHETILIVAHQAVLRIIYAYWMGLPNDAAPTVSMPLHTVIKLTPQTYGCREERELLYTHGEYCSSPSGLDRQSSITVDLESDPPSH